MTDTQRAELFRLALYTSQQPPPTPHINGIREWANGGTYGLRGTSGYGEVYGTHLLDRDTAAAMSGSGVSVSIDWASSNQLNLAYVIDSNATGGEHTLTISSMFGTSNGVTFTVADPTPQISSISPDTREAGRMIDFVINGTNFGSNPSISVSESGIGNATVTNSSNTQITAWVDLTYADSGTATVAVTSSGYGASNFIPAPGGATQNQGTKNVQITAATPTQLLVVNDCYWPNGASMTVGYTRVISYKVVGAQQQEFRGSNVPTVSESVVRTCTQCGSMSGNGVWSRDANTISASGVFNDFLTTNGDDAVTANQSFRATGNSQNLVVNIGGAWQVLSNYYSRTTVTVANTTAPRACHLGDPQ